MLEYNSDEKLYPQRIVVVGAGAVGWTFAATLGNGLNGLNVEIVVLDCGVNRDQLLPCNSATPAALTFNKMLGVDEKSFISQTKSAYFLATHYKNISGNSDYFMPFSEHGFMMNGIAFSSYALYSHAKGDNTAYDFYSLSALTARLGRFRHPSDNANSLLSTLDYGFQINTNNVAAYWRAYAIGKGVHEISCEIKSVQIDDISGDITSVTIDSLADNKQKYNNLIAADLYIDCTGEQALLIGKSLGVKYDSLESYLPANRQCYTTMPIQHAGAPYTTITPAPSGFIKETTTQTSKQLVYSYHTDFLTDNDAMLFLQNSNNNASAEYHFMPFSVGNRAEFWCKNCIAAGRAAGYLQDFVIDQLHLVQSAALRLVTLFPATKQYEINSKEYNRLTMLEYQHIIDFHQLHYKSIRDLKSPYWEYVNNTVMTHGLAHRLSTFSKRGVLPFYEGETLSPGTWASFLLGANFWPEAYDPIVDAGDVQWITEQLIKMRKMMSDAAQTIPLHHDYLRSFN